MLVAGSALRWPCVALQGQGRAQCWHHPKRVGIEVVEIGVKLIEHVTGCVDEICVKVIGHVMGSMYGLSVVPTAYARNLAKLNRDCDLETCCQHDSLNDF